MNKPLVMLLAGGGGTRLGVLVHDRSKPAVPFGGCYRIIDMALSNVMHAGFDWVGVLTQYQPLSLMSHIGTGEPWNFHGYRRGVRILPPRTGQAASDWYRGTADAVWQSMDFMRPLKPERVLVLSGDHVYRMDYRGMLAKHIESGADVTVAVREVAARDVSRFGMVWIDAAGNITRFEEKPPAADTRLASMGIYIFEWRCLVAALEEIVGSGKGTDFGQDVIPALLGRKHFLAHRFDGYWRDVGTLSSYFEASMDTLDPKSGLDLDAWEICTSDQYSGPGDRPPSRFGPRAELLDTRVPAGCRIDGRVHRSVLFPGVQVAGGARVEEAVLMDGVRVGEGAVIRRAIIDKDVCVGSGVIIDGGRKAGSNTKYGKCDAAGLSLIGKGVSLPAGLRVGSNVVIEPWADEGSFASDIPDGETVIGTADPVIVVDR
ncbi:MAG TPA: glucose-1-phosphate adenylyltransferase family protein [Myxococcota bacterium]|nr:glucose-1-phosphate adenylyltransferase family protein [Myxococcota bacterium]